MLFASPSFLFVFLPLCLAAYFASRSRDSQLGALASQDKGLRVIVAADKTVTYEKVVAAMDAARPNWGSEAPPSGRA